MVISTSFGGDYFTSTINCDAASPAMTTAAANCVAAGMTLFVSSGNDGYCDDMVAWGSGLAVDFDIYGLWNYDGTTWNSLAGWNPDEMVDVDLY